MIAFTKMSSEFLKGQCLSQVASHYGPFNPIPNRTFDVPISINIPRVTLNLQKNAGINTGTKIQLLQQIVDEVTKSVPATREGAFGKGLSNPYSVYTLVAFPSATGKSVRKFIRKLGKKEPWKTEYVKYFVLNSFHHGFGSDLNPSILFSAAGSMLYGDFIFSARSRKGHFTRQPCTIRIAKHFSIGDVVALTKVFSCKNQVVAHYLTYCLISFNSNLANKVDLEAARRKVKDMLYKATEESVAFLFEKEIVYFVANFLTEMTLRYLSQQSTIVHSAEDVQVAALSQGIRLNIDSIKCPHKYFTISKLEKKICKFFPFAFKKQEINRKLMCRTFIPLELVKDMKLDKSVQQDKLCFLVNEALISSADMFACSTLKKSRKSDNKLEYMTFLDHINSKADHWKTLGELVEGFYVMMYYEQMERIWNQHLSEPTIYSAFAKIRDRFDNAVLCFLEESYSSKKDANKLKLSPCEKCKKAVMSGKRFP